MANRPMHAKLDRLLEQARALAAERGRAVQRRRLCGASWDEVEAAVEAALPPAHRHLLTEVNGQVDDFESFAGGLGKPDEETPVHHFVLWLEGLRQGVFDLPAALPVEVMTAWRDSYQEMNGWSIYWGARQRESAADLAEMARMNPQCGYVQNWFNHPEDYSHRISPRIAGRCSDCRMGLPQRPGTPWDSCPACGSQRLETEGEWLTDLARALARGQAGNAASAGR